jgi:hypothetical protein
MKAGSGPSRPRKTGEGFASDPRASPMTIVRLASSFDLSQTKVEQGHIADVLIFELSRVALNLPKTFAGRKVGALVTRQKIGGGPSVLYAAAAILPSKDGADILLAFVKNALPLFKKAGLPEELDWQREQVVTA